MSRARPKVEPEFYSIREVAIILGISKKGVRRLIERRTLTAQRVGNAWRISIKRFREQFPPA